MLRIDSAHDSKHLAARFVRPARACDPRVDAFVRSGFRLPEALGEPDVQVRDRERVLLREGLKLTESTDSTHAEKSL